MDIRNKVRDKWSLAPSDIVELVEEMADKALDLEAENKDLQNRVDELETEVEELKSRIADLIGEE